MPKKPPQTEPPARIIDVNDNGAALDPNGDLKPLNIKDNKGIKNKRATAVAVTFEPDSPDLPRIAAAGRGKLAEQILQIAFDKGIKVREDPALADMLAKVELDSPIPSEAFLAVAEILSYVYKANGEPDPFNAIVDQKDS